MEIKGFHQSAKLKQWSEVVDDYINEQGKLKDEVEDDMAVDEDNDENSESNIELDVE
jgi:hypothetical protein